jgi:hypothetical protein
MLPIGVADDGARLIKARIRACWLSGLCWSTLPFGDGNEPLVFFNSNEKCRASTRGI